MSKEPQRSSILAAHLARAFPGLAVYHVTCDVQQMITIATSLQNLAVQLCNGFQTWDHKHDVKAEEKADRRRMKLQQKFRELLNDYPGVTPEFGGDPRGCVVKISIPGELGDSWSGGGFGVYK